MIKKILAAFGMFWSSISLSQAADLTDDDFKAMSVSDKISEEVKEICSPFLPDSLDFKECVEIVSMDFTVVPHNEGGTGTCPGPAKECNAGNSSMQAPN